MHLKENFFSFTTSSYSHGSTLLIIFVERWKKLITRREVADTNSANVRMGRMIRKERQQTEKSERLLVREI